MMLLSERDKKRLESFFRSKLVRPVRLLLFVQEQFLLWTEWSQPCQFCRETKELVETLSQLSPLIQAEIHDFDREQEVAERYQVDKIPALIVTAQGEDQTGVRYYGIPAGFEFTSLVEDIMDVSRGTTDIDAQVRQRIGAITTPTHIQVFVTPTCPYCPRAVRTAHKFALENPNIRADMVEANEFPDLAQRYQVLGVPKAVINETISFEGALPEHLFALYLLKAADQLTSQEATILAQVEQQMRQLSELSEAEEHEHHHHHDEHEGE
ncbi:MAG: thioredoxin family protein [Acidobacteriota bacterium]|nr:thioredoxin family protein [Blastocatellia bacterium]MDW8239914.1 thioredoxin family protein [Acidobacteriota bacterium]